MMGHPNDPLLFKRITPSENAIKIEIFKDVFYRNGLLPSDSFLETTYSSAYLSGIKIVYRKSSKDLVIHYDKSDYKLSIPHYGVKTPEEIQDLIEKSKIND